MHDITLTTPVHKDNYTAEVENLFGLKIEDNSTTIVKNNIQLPEKWSIGCLCSLSGAGKTTLLKTFGEIKEFKWNGAKSVVSNFPDKEAAYVFEAFCAAGFSSIPSWIRPYHCLSQGEQFRADLAASILISNDNEIILIDEFTSKTDRNIAKAASNSLQKFIRKTNKKIIVATCHEDILEYLAPNWYYNPQEGVMHTASDLLQRPPISLDIIRCKQSAWELFRKSHYLNTTLNSGARCFLALWNNIPVAFSACLSLPHPSLGYSWRETRTVVLPDYQGFGIGTTLSDFVASMAKATGCNFYSKTSHPAMVNYRLRSDNWKETKGSRKSKNTHNKNMIERGWIPTDRKALSFEYIGNASTDEEAKLFYDDQEFCQAKKKRKYKKGEIHLGQGHY